MEGWIILVGSIVLILSVLFVCIYLRKRTFPLVRLLVIRLFKGQYSFEYLEFFKKNDLRNPLNTCIRDEITVHFSFFFRPLENGSFHSTSVPVSEFRTIPFLTEYKEVTKKLGVPDCINIARFGTHRVKVIGYSEWQNKRKIKVLFYFIETRFVMGEYVFSETHRMDPTGYRQALIDKFIQNSSPDADTFYLKDPTGNLINYHDNGFYASVKYLCRTDPKINHILEEVFPDNDASGKEFRRALLHEELINRF